MASAKMVLIPLGVLAGLAGAVGLAVWKVKRASASPLEEEPTTPLEQGAPSESMLATEYGKAMSPETQDLEYLQRVSELLDENGKTAWAAQVRTRISAIKAGKGAAIAAAQADVAHQAAATQAEMEPGKQQWASTAGEPSQADVDKMYDWAMREDSTDTAIVQTAFQMVLAWDKSPARETRIAILGDKLVKLKSGTYGVASPTQAAGTTPIIVKEAGKEAAIPVPSDAEVAVEPEPLPGVTTLPPLPDEPSPDIPAAHEPSTDGVPELAKEETSAAADPNSTIALARAMIDVEDETGWKEKLQPLIANWQKKVALLDDGKFGEKSALRMGQEVGVLPLVRFFSKSFYTKKSALDSYRRSLYDLADRLDAEGKGPHAVAIRLSAEHETGQSWPKTPAPVVTPDGSPARIVMLDKLLTAMVTGGEAG